MDSFSSDLFNHTPFDFEFGDFSADSGGIDAFNLGGHIDFMAFDVPGHEALNHSMFDINNANEFSDMIDFIPTMNWLASPAPILPKSQYELDPDLDPDFEFNLRDGLRAEMLALDTVITEALQSDFTFTDISSPPEHEPPVIEKKKPVKKSRAQKPSSNSPSRITKPRTRKPKTPKAKIALPSPTTHPFTLYQEHRLQASVLQFLGSPSLQQQFQIQFGTSPERLQQFLDDPEEQQRLLQAMVNRELANPAFQRMLLQSSYGCQD
jgi:hypothetical protein